MTLYEAIEENSKLEALSKILHSIFIEYDNSVEKYRDSINHAGIDTDLDNDVDSDAIIDAVESQEEIKSSLKEVISKLNKLQVVFEKIGYTTDTSVSDDVNEGNFLNQLKQFQEQCLRLDENLDRASFRAFYNDLSYLTTLAEIHYNHRFGKLEENISVSEGAEETLEETEDYLESLPEIKTNEIDD